MAIMLERKHGSATADVRATVMELSNQVRCHSSQSRVNNAPTNPPDNVEQELFKPAATESVATLLPSARPARIADDSRLVLRDCLISSSLKSPKARSAETLPSEAAENTRNQKSPALKLLLTIDVGEKSIGQSSLEIIRPEERARSNVTCVGHSDGV